MKEGSKGVGQWVGGEREMSNKLDSCHKGIGGKKLENHGCNDGENDIRVGLEHEGI